MLHFSNYFGEWMASSPVGVYSIKRYRSGWQYSGPGVHGWISDRPVEDVVALVSEQYAERIRQAFNDLDAALEKGDG